MQAPRPLEPGESEPDLLSFDEEMIELVLLLPARQVAALARLARRRQVTLGQLLRHVIRQCLHEEEAS